MLNKKILKLLGVAYHDLASITIFADGSGHIDDDAMDFEFSENKKCFAFKDVAELEAHLTKRALDAASAAHAEAVSSPDIIPASVAGSQPRQ